MCIRKRRTYAFWSLLSVTVVVIRVYRIKKVFYRASELIESKSVDSTV